MRDLITLLTAHDFETGDQKSDIGDVVPYIFYFVRPMPSGKFLYVTLITYSVRFIGLKTREISLLQGEFVEAITEVFATRKNSKRPKGLLKLEEAQKQGFAPLKTQLLRNKNEVQDFILQTDAL